MLGGSVREGHVTAQDVGTWIVAVGGARPAGQALHQPIGHGRSGPCVRAQQMVPPAKRPQPAPLVLEHPQRKEQSVRHYASGRHGTSSGGPGDFIRAIAAADLRAGEYGTIVTRFPPEPNGYLHVGHAKSIVLNFGIAREMGGRCHLRFDDTNPETEDQHFVESIQETVRWLGFDWGEHLYFASDYFPQMNALAEFLIREGNAYVDDASEEEVREARGAVTEPGRPTPSRARPAEESLDLFRRMRAGEFPDGSHVLRGRIDLASPNMLMRDPILYRIRHAHHYRTGDRWCIYPLYDYAHPIEDTIEGITHSLCTLEFENNRPLYDWAVQAWQRFAATRGLHGTERDTPAAAYPGPRQYEFARGNLEYTVLSKRKLLELVRGGYVSGWDDPRMPTLAGMRRRGVTPEAIRAFWEGVGVTKVDNRIDAARLEHAIRDDLNHRAPRVLCVLDPLKVVITDHPEGQVEWVDAPYYPHDVPKQGSRALPLGREIYIDRDDFAENPPKGFHRLSPGGSVRLRHTCMIRCDEVIKDEAGEVVELRCSSSPAASVAAPDGQRVKGTIHWVSADHAVPCEVRLYDRLFRVPDPDAGEGDFKEHLNPDSLVAMSRALVEPSVKDDPAGSRYQFERLGYFFSDPVESRPGALVFNRTVALRDTWGKRPANTPFRERKRKRPVEGRVTRDGSEGEPVVAATAPAGVALSEYVGTVPGAARVPDLEPRAVRYSDELGIPREDAELLIQSTATADLFEAALGRGASARAVASWILHELPRTLGEAADRAYPFAGEALGELVALVEGGVLSRASGREVLKQIAVTGDPPAMIVERLGLRRMRDPLALGALVDEVVAASPDKAEAFRAGRSGLLGFFIGEVMRRTGRRADPEEVRTILLDRLHAS